jgi:hypothetical protein
MTKFDDIEPRLRQQIGQRISCLQFDRTTPIDEDINLVELIRGLHAPPGAKDTLATLIRELEAKW